MPQPTPYTPTTDFSQQEANNASGRSTVNTAALDAEFANIEATLDQTLANLQLIQRDDGLLGDVTVEVRCLSPDVLNVMGGFNLTGLWVEDTDYAVNDICSHGEYTYVCKTAHNSGPTFSTTNWIQFGFTSGSDAAQAAANAQASASAALVSQNAAAASASTATTQASNAAASATTATNQANSAASSASSASTSATSASNSATVAQSAAASIVLPIPIASGGTGSTNATAARAALGLGDAATKTIGTGVGQVPTADQVPGLGVPAGAVMHFARSSAPSGWLKANGALVSRTTYSALFAAIGTTFGIGDGATTFALPDLRGEFIRGLDDGRAVDSGRVLGSAQGDEIKSHSHTTGSAFSGSGGVGAYSGTTGYTTATGATGGAETRPRNIALLACIKY